MHPTRMMAAFQRNKFRGSSDMGKAGAKYRAMMAKYPFWTFGLPFMAVIIGGSFVLTPATAVRYERQDRKVKQMSKEEELGVRRGARRVDMREEYNRLAGNRDLDSWEQKRVKRLPGENDGILE